LVEKHESQALTTKNTLDKEKQDALVVAKYKEIFKMEQYKKDEEEYDREKEREVKKEEIRRQEKMERKRQEELKIMTEKKIEDKEEEFK
jgi:hypothetical protein